MGAVKKQNGHGDTSLDTAVSLKKGDFNTPSVNPFFQKENGGLKCNISKPPLGYCILFWRVSIQPPKQRFFYYRWANSIFIKFTYLRMGANRVPLF